MELSQETEDYIRDSIHHTAGLSVSTDTLLHKLQTLDSAHSHLHRQSSFLRSKLNEKDQLIQWCKAETSMNAVGLKKFVEENEKLAVECCNLLAKCERLERECSLYDCDREALMDFANEADERAKKAELRNFQLEEENTKLGQELHLLKCRQRTGDGDMADVPTEDQQREQGLLDSLLTTMFGKDELTANAHGFLEANNGVEACENLLNMWNSLRPSTHKVVALVAEAKTLENDKKHLTVNLRRAETEVNVLFEENSYLNEENKKLIRLYQERLSVGSDGKHTDSASTKARRIYSPNMRSPVDKKIDFGYVDAQRLPFSPLQYNSPEPTRSHKRDQK